MTPPRGGGGKLSGALNYSDDNVDALLDEVASVEPIGVDNWALVVSDFNEYAIENVRPKCDMESLKRKFDKMANMKKRTGDPSFQPRVRRAKHI